MFHLYKLQLKKHFNSFDFLANIAYLLILYFLIYLYGKEINAKLIFSYIFILIFNTWLAISWRIFRKDLKNGETYLLYMFNVSKRKYFFSVWLVCLTISIFEVSIFLMIMSIVSNILSAIIILKIFMYLAYTSITFYMLSMYFSNNTKRWKRNKANSTDTFFISLNIIIIITIIIDTYLPNLISNEWMNVFSIKIFFTFLIDFNIRGPILLGMILSLLINLLLIFIIKNKIFTKGGRRYDKKNFHREREK